MKRYNYKAVMRVDEKDVTVNSKTQAGLAKALGISRCTVIKLLHKKDEPTHFKNICITMYDTY